MQHKITIEDLLNKPKQETNPVHSTLKEDLDRIKSKIINSASLTDIVPDTIIESKLLKAIQKDTQEKIKLKTKMFDFDRKMQRINRIKSHNYRRLKRRERERLNELEQIDSQEEEHCSDEEEKDSDEKIDLSEEENNSNEEESVDTKDSDNRSNDNENEFKEEKQVEINKSKETNTEIILPGWGAWGGEGLEVSKNKYNVIKNHNPSVPRKDLNLPNVIVNTNQPILDDKYKIILPRNFSKKLFNKKINAPPDLKKEKKKEFEEFCFEPMDDNI